jgi:hypothetical protein
LIAGSHKKMEDPLNKDGKVVFFFAGAARQKNTTPPLFEKLQKFLSFLR